jgi:iron complex transport system substrate-binding protein
VWSRRSRERSRFLPIRRGWLCSTTPSPAISIDLDVPVVATTPEVTESDGEFSQFWSEKAKAQGTEFLPWSNDGFDLEAIIEAEPDLIIAGGIGFPLKHATDAYDRLQEVAPTVVVSGDKQTWQDQFSFIASDVLGQAG